MTLRLRLIPRSPRRGATLVEMAVILPVFAIFLAAIVEFGHCYLVINTLNAAATRAARSGAVSGVSTTQVKNEITGIVSRAIKTTNVTTLVKDGSTFDNDTVTPSTINYSSLPDIELLNAQPLQLYVVQVSVPYDTVALLPPFWAKNLTLKGQAVMRHE